MATAPQDVETPRTGVSGGQVLLAVLGLLALVVVLWFVFLRGGPEEDVAVVPPVVTSPLPSPEPTERADGKTTKEPIETFEVFAPKDPFKPLVSSVVTGTTSGTTTTGGTGTSGAPAGPGTGAPSGGSDISGGGGSSNDGSSSVRGHRVRVVDTYRSNGRERARVQVDGTVYTVGEGDRFAENFQLLSISNSCASLLFGDDQFSLCEGEEILK